MKQTFVYVGLDVDDTQYHGSAFNKHTGEVIDFHWRPKEEQQYTPVLSTRNVTTRKRSVNDANQQAQHRGVFNL